MQTYDKCNESTPTEPDLIQLPPLHVLKGCPPPGFHKSPPPGFHNSPPPGFHKSPPPGFPPHAIQQMPSPRFYKNYPQPAWIIDSNNTPSMDLTKHLHGSHTYTTPRGERMAQTVEVNIIMVLVIQIQNGSIKTPYNNSLYDTELIRTRVGKLRAAFVPPDHFMRQAGTYRNFYASRIVSIK